MFRNVFTKSLRDYRWAILGWGMGLGVIVFVQYALFSSTFTAASSNQIQQLVQQFQFFGEAVRVDTPGGFVTFKIMGMLPAILGIWTVLAGARMIRGDEEHGVLDIVLSTPQSRVGVIVQKLLALALGTAAIALLIALWILAGMATAGVTVDPAAALLAAFNASLAAFLFGALALLVAHFTSRTAAAGWAGGLMALSYVVDGTGRASHSTAGLRKISAFYYYNRSLPLVPGHSVSLGALGLLLGICVLFSGAAVLLFPRRDIGRSLLADVTLRPRESRPASEVFALEQHDVWVRGIGLQAVRRQSGVMVWWVVSLSVYAGYLVGVAKTSEKQFQQLLGSSPFIKQIFSGTNLGTNNGFLSALVFSYLQLLLPIFAGILASRWASDLDTGRLELVLGSPVPRPRVILERYAAVAAAAAVTAFCVWLSIVIASRVTGLSLDLATVAGATGAILPISLIAASLVFALAGLLRRAAVLGIMAVFLGVSFLADAFRTLLALPNWVLNLSIFYQYGTPMVHGVNWPAFVVMLLAAAAILGSGTWRFSTRDVDRGAAGS